MHPMSTPEDVHRDSRGTACCPPAESLGIVENGPGNLLLS